MRQYFKPHFRSGVFTALGCATVLLLSACAGGTVAPGGFATVDADAVNDEGATVMPVTVFRNPDRCGAQNFQSYKGQSFSVISSSLPSGYRKIGPREQARADYDINRITVEVDGADRIIGVYCG